MQEPIEVPFRRKRLLYLAVSMLALLFLGLLYAFSMFAAPMSETFGLDKAGVGLTFNIMMIAFCVGSIAGSQIEKVVGVKWTIVLAGALFFIGFAGTSLFAHGSLMAVYLLYGVCAGAGVGIGYNCICATTNQWFPDKVGFSSGMLMMSFGISTLVCGNIAIKFVGSFGLSTVFSALGAITLAATIACALVLKRPPSVAAAAAKASASGNDPVEDAFALKAPVFYAFWAWAIIIVAIGLATIGSCASDAQLVGIDAQTATFLVGVVSTANGGSRIITGAIYDRTNVKVTMLVLAVLSIVATVCVAAAMATGISPLYVVGAICCGACYGGVPVVSSAFSRQRFGAKNYPFNLSLANMCIVFGSLLNIAVQAAVGGSTERLGLFLVMIVFAVICAADVLPFSKLWNKDMKMIESQRAGSRA